MPDAKWNLIQDLFLDALETPEAERGPFLERACAGDAALLAEVRALLRSDAQNQKLASLVEQTAEAVFDEGLIGSRLGAYRILEQIGRGGMGTVYLACRADDQYEKKVAIKLVRRGMDTADLLLRFRHERQILANLEHPYCARLLDGGTSPDGRPFLVMEHVEGLPIDEYCRRQNLDLRERCDLFLKVCEAVSYAHRNLVVHRDLKPGNILVDATGTPRLLDFGVAKLLTPELKEGMTVSHPGPMLTPDFASPEQVLGEAVTTAADIYALGGILYCLLTGQPPHQLKSHTTDEVRRVVCEERAKRPSETVDARAEFRPGWSRRLRGDLDAIVLTALRKEPERRYASVDQLAEDLRRYRSGFPVLACEDTTTYRVVKFVRRHAVGVAATAVTFASLLAGLMISIHEAQEAKAAHRTAEQQRQIAEENSRQAVAAREAEQRQFERAELERDIAVQERARAVQGRQDAQRARAIAEQRQTQLVELANRSLFEIHGAIESLPGATEARKRIVSTTVEYLNKASASGLSDPSFRLALATAYYRVGDVQGYPHGANLGDSTGALASYARALGLLLPLRPDVTDNAAVVKLWMNVKHSSGAVLDSTGREQEAAATYFEGLASARRLTILAPGSTDGPMGEARLHSGLANILYSSDPPRALEEARSALAILQALAKQNPLDPEILEEAAGAEGLVTNSLSHLGRFTEALAHARASAAIREKLAEMLPQDVNRQRSLMLAYGHVAAQAGSPLNGNQGDLQESVEYYRRALAIAEKLHQADPRNWLAQRDLTAALSRISAVEFSAGDYRETVRDTSRAIELLKDLRSRDPRHAGAARDLALSYEYQGRALVELGRFADAGSAYRASLEIAEARVRENADEFPSCAQVLATMRALAQLQARQGDETGAMQWSQRAVELAHQYAARDRDPSLHYAYIPQSYFGLGEVERTLARRSASPEVASMHWQHACSAFATSLEEWNKLNQMRPSDHSRRQFEKTRAALEDCRRARR